MTPRPHRWLALALVACAALAARSAVGGDEPPRDAAPPTAPAAGTPAEDAFLRALVWAAVDAPDDTAADRLRSLAGAPGAGWSGVAGVLRGGRDPSERLPLPRPVTDAAAFAAYFDAFPWDVGRVRIYRLGDDAGHWYSVELPPAHDADGPVPVWFDFGLFAGGAPPGFARVRLNDLIPGSPTLGRAPSSMTAGFAVQSIVLSVCADLERRFRVDRDRVFCGGYSRFGNMTWYEGVHFPDLWAGIAPASGYYEFSDAFLPNLARTAVLAASGTDPGHRDSNAYTARAADRLRTAGHGDVTTHRPDGRAVDGLERVLPGWAAERRRDPLPREFTCVLADPRHRGAWWGEITAVKSPGTARTVVIGAPGDDTAERFQVNARPAVLTVKLVGANRIEVRATNVAEFRLLLSPDLFDLTRPVEVTLGARTVRVTPEPSVATLIRRFRETGDGRRLCAAEVTLRP